LRRGFSAKSAAAAQSRRIASFHFTKPQCGRGLIAGDRRGQERRINRRVI
jgi:hypothetical protein